MQLSLKNDNDKYEIGGKIRERRTALGLSQDELADMVGTDGNSISRHENGTREMKISRRAVIVYSLLSPQTEQYHSALPPAPARAVHTWPYDGRITAPHSVQT